MAITNTTRTKPSRFGTARSLNRVRKYLEIFGDAWNDSGTCESFQKPVIPPAPLTGDVGRDRGDAGRALLFFFFSFEKNCVACAS
jgi:hypothetical protein